MPQQRPTKAPKSPKGKSSQPSSPAASERSAPKPLIIKARTETQKQYLQTIRENVLSFGIGPAGTGKTYLAVAMAIQALRAGEVERIILVRPAVESGEKLGYLPGTLEEKVTPYLIPLLDAMKDLLPKGGMDELMKQGKLELATLAFMRGRTLSRSFVILDEAQNTTVDQLHMAVTRIGEGTKMVITGDPTQVDLPAKIKSGLTFAKEAFTGLENVGFCEFNDADVVRHPLVRALIVAHRKWKEHGV